MAKFCSQERLERRAIVSYLVGGVFLMLFARYARHFGRVVLLCDALSTPYALARESEKSRVGESVGKKERSWGMMQPVARCMLIRCSGNEVCN